MGTVDTGRDTYCLDELQPGRMARGKTLVAQRCYHRLITPSRTLRGGEEEADFGLDLAGYVGSVEAEDLEALLPVAVKNELLKDPAVDSVEVTATRVEAAGQVRWTLDIAIETTAGDVDLIVAVDAVSVELLRVG